MKYLCLKNKTNRDGRLTKGCYPLIMWKARLNSQNQKWMTIGQNQ